MLSVKLGGFPTRYLFSGFVILLLGMKGRPILLITKFDSLVSIIDGYLKRKASQFLLELSMFSRSRILVISHFLAVLIALWYFCSSVTSTPENGG